MKFYNQFLRDTRQFQQLHLGKHCGNNNYYCQATSDHLKLRVMFMATTPSHNHESYQKCIFIFFGGGGVREFMVFMLHPRSLQRQKCNSTRTSLVGFSQNELALNPIWELHLLEALYPRCISLHRCHEAHAITGESLATKL